MEPIKLSYINLIKMKVWILLIVSTLAFIGSTSAFIIFNVLYERESKKIDKIQPGSLIQLNSSRLVEIIYRRLEYVLTILFAQGILRFLSEQL